MANQEKKVTPKKGISRRGLLKTAGFLGMTAAVSTLAKVPGMSEEAGKVFAAESVAHDSFPLEIAKDYQRFDFKNVIFMRGAYDPEIAPIGKMWRLKSENKLPQPGNPGWTEVDAALFRAAWAVHDNGGPRNSAGVPQSGALYKWDYESNPRKTTFQSPEEASRIVKRAATFLGASLVGICDYDERWVYSNWYNPGTKESIPVKFPFEPKSVIVLALEIDYEGMKTAPSLIEQAATGNQYSNMASISHKVATFCRELGYKAANCGNDTAMSIPLAIAAGLGELSRMGMLVTQKYGPRVRLCKVITDLPLKADKPISFGVTEFCKVCKKCVDNCPSSAISGNDEPSFKTENISNVPGVKKWCVNAEKCYKFWSENGGDCGSCISCCPYNKIDEWHHQMSSMMTRTPARPILRYFDELFGYGKTYNQKAIEQFWKK